MRTIQYRRKREGKTDYKKRLRTVKGRISRLVIRPSIKNITIQIIDYYEVGDKVLVGTNSQVLEKYGWKAPNGNIPAAYLTGLLLGKLAVRKGVKNVILDTGFVNPVKKGRIYACLKGVIDSGVQVIHSGEIFPDEERIKGKHIADYAKMLNEGEAKKKFAGYFAGGADPRNIENVFEETKKKLLKNEEKTTR